MIPTVTNARGENVKLLLEDAGLNHNYIRLPRGEVWAAKKAQLIDEGFLSPTLPFIEVGDKKYGKAIPIMQYISAKLGNKYHGSDVEEEHYLAYVAEVTTEWYECLRTSFFGTDVSEYSKQSYYLNMEFNLIFLCQNSKIKNII